VNTQVPAAQAVKCDSCGRTVTLTLKSATAAETAWRWFDCPYCRKANFLRLPGQILRATKGEQEL
jgi:hypothetical protein